MAETREPGELKPHPYSTRIFRQRTPGARFITEFAEEQEEPLAVTPESHFTDWPEETIIDGHRRWLAAMEAEMDEVEVRLVEYESPEREKRAILHQDDNRDPVFSQQMRLAEEYEAEIAPLVQQRIKAGKPLDELDDPLQDFAEGNVTTRDLVADRLGWSGEKLRQARKVWEAYQDDEEWAQKSVRELDAGELSVNKGFNRYQRKQLLQELREEDNTNLVGQVGADALPSPVSVFPFVGGKNQYARWIISRMPKHKTYVEPFGGSADILMNKPPSVAEVYNDRDPDIATFFEVLRDDVSKLEGQLELLPFNEDAHDEYTSHWFDSWRPESDALRAAIFFFSRYATWGSKHANKGGYAGDNNAKEYHNKVRQLRGFHKRFSRDDPAYFIDRFRDLFPGQTHADSLRRMDFNTYAGNLSEVMVDHFPYQRVLDRHDGPDTLHYMDPPYMEKEHYYRVGRDFDHDAFAERITELEGKWMVSYGEEIPDALKGYRQEAGSVSRQIRQDKASVERLIMNFPEEEEGWFFTREYPVTEPEAGWESQEVPGL